MRERIAGTCLTFGFIAMFVAMFNLVRHLVEPRVASEINLLAWLGFVLIVIGLRLIFVLRRD